MKFLTIVKHVDVETGEIINLKNIQQYYIIKKNKNVRQIGNTNKRLIEITNECRRKPEQGRIF